MTEITNTQSAYEVVLTKEEMAFLRVVLRIVKGRWSNHLIIGDNLPPIEYLVSYKIDPLLEKLTPKPQKEETLLLGKIPVVCSEDLPPNAVALVSEPVATVAKNKAPSFPPRKALTDQSTPEDKEQLRKVAHEAMRRLGITLSDLSIQLYGRRNAISNYKAPSTRVSKSAIDDMCQKIKSLHASHVEEPDPEETIFAGILLRREKEDVMSPGPCYTFLGITTLIQAAQWCAQFQTNKMVMERIALSPEELEAVRGCKPLVKHMRRMLETDRGNFDKNILAFINESRSKYFGGWVKLVATSQEMASA